MCKIEFDVGNAAFRENDENGQDAVCLMEVADTVSRVAQKIGAGYTNGPIVDANGNKVGRFSVED